MEWQAPLGSQFCEMSAFGVEVIVDFVGYLDLKGGRDKKISWTQENCRTAYSMSCTVASVDHMQLQLHQ